MSGAPAGPQPILAWLAAPALASLAASALFAAPLRLFGLPLPEPVFAFVPAFAWAMIRPSVLPSAVLLAMGLALDLLWGGPLGLWPLVLLAAYGGVFVLRRLLGALGPAGLWACYGGACAAALALGWAMVAARSGVAPSLVGVAWQWLACLPLFPFAWRMVEDYERTDVRFR